MKRDIFQAIADPTRRAIISLIMVQAMTERKMSQRSIRFPLPVTITIYNESIAIVERWHSVELPELKFQDVEQINRCAPAP